MAPRPRRRRARRDRRGRAGSLGRPRAGSRRPCRCGSVPRARRRADAGSHAARPACAGGGARGSRCGSGGCRIRASDGCAARTAGRARGRPALNCSRRRSRSAPGAAAMRHRCSSPRRGASSRSTPRCPASRISRRSGRRASPCISPVRADSLDVAVAVRAAPPRGRNSEPRGPDARRSGHALRRRLPRRRADAAARAGRVPPYPDGRSRRHVVGMARRRAVGRRRLVRARRPARQGRPRCRRAHDASARSPYDRGVARARR